MTADLQAERLLLIHMADTLATAAVLSAVKTRQRLTAVQLMRLVGLQRILLQQVLPKSVRLSLLMQSVLQNLFPLWLILSAPALSLMKKSVKL